MIKNFKDYISEKKDPCWKGYKKIGTKIKKGKVVPNCVPDPDDEIEEEKNEGLLLDLITKHFGKDTYDIFKDMKERIISLNLNGEEIPMIMIMCDVDYEKYINDINIKGGEIKEISMDEYRNHYNIKENYKFEKKDGKIIYRGETFPGFNIPKKYKGDGKYKFRVLAREDGKIKIINFGHSDYEDYTTHKDKDRRRNFRKRHQCDPVRNLSKLTRRYWSCQYLW